MIRILLVYTDNGLNQSFINGLEKQETLEIISASSGTEALELIFNNTIHLVVTAETLTDMSGITLIEKLVMVNPFVNSAVVSSLSEEDFHEVTEGLGILMSIPSDADDVFADELLNYLSRINTCNISNKGLKSDY